MTRTLPLLISVPHAGLEVPSEVAPFCRLTPAEIVRDGDEEAAEIYDLEGEVSRFVTADVARAIVDLNRDPTDRRKDGVVKTHTCWDVPVYDPFPPEVVLEELIERYHRPYHRTLATFARETGVVLSVDCHTMAAHGPPIGPDAGKERPAVCLGDGDGALPAAWFDRLVACFRDAFGGFRVTGNDPFRGGYITRHHGRKSPWAQIELSRAPFLPTVEKRRRVLAALTAWCRDSKQARVRRGIERA